MASLHSPFSTSVYLSRPHAPPNYPLTHPLFIPSPLSLPAYPRSLLRARNAPHPLTIRCVRQHKAAAVTKESWDKMILQSETPVLVEFYASWCGPCRMVHRVIDEIATEYAGRLKCYVLNTDDDLQLAEDYEIKAVPVVVLFKNGKKCDSVVGTMPRDFYVAAIERVLE